LHPKGIQAQRLKRVFNIDIETCQACGGTVRIIDCIEDPVVIEKNLAHLKRVDCAINGRGRVVVGLRVQGDSKLGTDAHYL